MVLADTTVFILRGFLRPEPAILNRVSANPAPNPPPATSPPVRPLTGIGRLLFVTAGLGFVGLAYLGVLLPGLPTTPWLILASYCFARSSPRLQEWLLRSPVFGKLLRDWHEHRGIRRPVKVLAVCIIVPVVTLSLVYGGLPVWVRWVVGGLAGVGVCVVLFVVPTIRDNR